MEKIKAGKGKKHVSQKNNPTLVKKGIKPKAYEKFLQRIERKKESKKGGS
jgi:hypothetical protein